jgi:hypothetical protein
MDRILSPLRATPTLLRELTATLDPAEYGWKPSPGRWSVEEVLGHLIHVEALGFRLRAERILREDNPLLEAYDPDEFAAAGAYSGRPLAVALDEFTAERAASLTVLSALGPASLERPGRHSKLGDLVLANLLHEWVFHDLGHIRQVAELVRSRRHYPHLGPWQQFYSVNP